MEKRERRGGGGQEGRGVQREGKNRNWLREGTMVIDSRECGEQNIKDGAGGGGCAHILLAGE